MSTNSFIAIEQDNGKYRAIYCHHDGHLFHHGEILLNHYQYKQKVEDLINLGDISSLAAKLRPKNPKRHSFDPEFGRERDVVLAYARDRGDEGTEAREFTLEELQGHDADWIEFTYIFTEENEWKYFDNQNKELRSVADDFVKKFKNVVNPRKLGKITSKLILDAKQKQTQEEM